MRSDCTVLVASCEKYKDVLGPFSRLWRKYWPDCPFPVVLVTETDPEDYGVFSQVMMFGDGLTWGERLKLALEKVVTPNVLMLCDDYYLAEKVDTARVCRRLEQLVEYDAVNLRMIPNPTPTKPFEKDASLGEYEKDTAYCIATQAGFWNKEFLLSLASNAKSIWEFERYGSFRVGAEKRPILATQQKEFPFVDAVHKGCWEPWGVRIIKENGIDYDFSKRGTPSFSVRVREGVKALIFKLFPWTLIVRVQNLLGVGMKEKKKVE